MDDRERWGRRDAPHGADGAGAHLDEEVLNTYLDLRAGTAAPDALDPAIYAAAEAHLARCAACRGALGELEGTVTLLRALPQIAPRRSFVLTPETIAAAGGEVRRPRRPRLAWVWPVRWASALVTLLLVLTIGLDLSDSGPGPAQAPPPAPTATAMVTTVFLTTGLQGAATRPLGTSVATQAVLTAAGVDDTPIVFPTPTPLPLPPTGPVTQATEQDWRPVEIGLGALASLLAFFGFAVPPLLRRHGAAA